MCIRPSEVWVDLGGEWQKQAVACRQCWRCRQNRVNDYVGRALAEAAYSERTATVTLTYAPREDLADKVLHPRHFQLFMKLLRRAGHKVRYLVAGEYGDLKGRAHFHVLLFFTHFAPGDGEAFYNPEHMRDPLSSARFSAEMPHKRMVHIREWPHGHVKCDWTGDEQAIRYVCKYLLADDKNSAWFSVSKKPALGAAFFAAKAAQARALGVLPSKMEYMPPGGTRGRPYLITGASRRDYLNAITTDPGDRDRMSEWVRKTFDKLEAARLLDLSEQFWAADGGERMLAAMRRAQGVADRGRAEVRRRFWADLSDALAEGDEFVLHMGEWKPKEPTNGTETEA